MSDLSLKAIEIAVSEIGKEEKPRGSNWGEPVKNYLEVVGINFPASWCMAFVYWNFNEAAYQMGINNPLVKTGGVLSAYYKHKNSHGFKPGVKELQPGDIFIQDHGHGLGHTGIIESVNNDGTVNTIEGNTNVDGSREGFAVERKVRKVISFVGALRY